MYSALSILWDNWRNIWQGHNNCKSTLHNEQNKIKKGGRQDDNILPELFIDFFKYAFKKLASQQKGAIDGPINDLSLADDSVILSDNLREAKYMLKPAN